MTAVAHDPALDVPSAATDAAEASGSGEPGAASAAAPLGMPAWARLVQPVALAVWAALGGVVTIELVRPHRTWWVTAAAALVAAVVNLVILERFAPTVPARRRSRSPSPRWGLIVLGVNLVGLAATAVVTTMALPGPAGSSRGVIDAVTRGWSDLVRTGIPADAGPRLLVPLALVAWAAAAAGVVLARTTLSAARPLLPGAVALVGAAIVAGRHPWRPELTGLIALATAGTFLAARAARPVARSGGPSTWRRGAATVRRLGVGAVVVATIGVLAGVVGPVLVFGRDDQAFDLRRRFEPPVSPATATNPLDLVASRRTGAPTPMFTVRTDAETRTRLVVLDSFDGARWSVTRPYERTGSLIQLADDTTGPGSVRRIDVRIDQLNGAWLPSFGRPQRIEGTRVAVDPMSGALVALDAAVVSGTEYVLTAADGAPTFESLRTVPEAQDAEAIAATALPGDVPDVIDELADTAIAGAETAVGTALRIELYLRANYTVDPEAVGGFSYGNIVRTLTATRTGAPEEFAAAFAVLARSSGLPTRLVVGFGPGTPVGDGSYLVTANDAIVWPEVKFAGVGWVAFDPVPSNEQTLDDQQEVVDPDRQQVIEEETPTPTTIPPPDDPLDEPDSGGWGWPIKVALGVAALVGVVTLGAVVVAIVKARQTRRRRRRGDPRDQVVGAWEDLLDRWIEVDRGARPQLGVEEVVARSAELVGGDGEATGEGLAGLPDVVDRALYGRGGTTHDEARTAWASRDIVVSAMKSAVHPWTRARRATSPRPLGWGLRPSGGNGGHGGKVQMS